MHGKLCGPGVRVVGARKAAAGGGVAVDVVAPPGGGLCIDKLLLELFARTFCLHGCGAEPTQ